MSWANTEAGVVRMVVRVLLVQGLFAYAIATGGLAEAMESSRPVEFYVATDGNDAWSGRLDAPNEARTDGPFATVKAARDAIRALRRNGGPRTPVTVRIREGIYFLDEPLELTPQDSGAANAPVVYAAYPGERPILSGGVPVTGWEPTEIDGKTVWTAPLPSGAHRVVHQLFVNGERRRRARYPNEGWLQVEALPDVTRETPWNEGQTRFQFAAGDLKEWPDADQGEIVALHFWVDSHLPITRIDEETRIVEFGKRSVFRLTSDHGPSGAFYYVENVLAALDQPGEWYLNATEGKLYYLPMPGEEIDSVHAIVPRLSQVVRIDGAPEAGTSVRYITFRGLTFRHTEWWFGPEYEPDWPKKDIGGMVQAAFAVPGAIWLSGARNIRIEDSTISQVGTYGIELGRGSQDNEIIYNTISDLGAGGVKIGETTIRERANEQTHRNIVSDNVIAGGGRLFHSAVGVWVGQSGGNVIAHNEIRDFYYTGVSVGWSWGYGRSLSAHNRIEYNHIHTIGQGWLSDMGGIYTLGVSPGMVIRNNLIHDVVARGYGGWGIYPDEGTSHAVIENNVVYRTNRCGFHLHYGKDNLIQNNIFAFAGDAQICRTRPDPFVFRRNIVYWREGSLLGGNWSELNVTMDENLYFNAAGHPIRPGGRSFQEWQAAGMDTHSLIEDPRFVDADHDDFRLRPDSPAWKLGFQPIDLREVGPRPR